MKISIEINEMDIAKYLEKKMSSKEMTADIKKQAISRLKEELIQSLTNAVSKKIINENIWGKAVSDLTPIAMKAFKEEVKVELKKKKYIEELIETNSFEELMYDSMTEAIKIHMENSYVNVSLNVKKPKIKKRK